jgi:predicted RNase H-like HicB family nuclease
MKMLDVIIEPQNGHYRALVPGLPDIFAEASSRDEALALVRQAAEAYLSRVEVAVIEVGTAAERLRPGSPQSVVRASLNSRLDPDDHLYQQYLKVRGAEEARQKAAAEREADDAGTV